MLPTTRGRAMTDRRPQGVSSEIPNALDDRPQNLFIKQMKYWDVVFTFPNLPDRIEAHELYLKARSPVFKQMFRKRKSGEVHVREVEIKESTPQRFQQFLEFIYTEKFEVNPSGALDLLQLANQYEVELLITKCEELLKADINIENSIHTFETARRYGNDELVARAGEVMAQSMAYLLENDALVTAEEETLIYLLKRDDLYVKEKELFQLILKWGRNKVAPSVEDNLLQEKLKNIIPLIRYTNMTLKVFTAMVLPARLLSAEDMLSVYSYGTGDEAMRNNMQMRFKTTPRSKVGFADFIDGPTSRRVRREQISVSPLKLCISFQVQPLEKVSANNGLKKPAITAIIVEWPSQKLHHSKMRDDPRTYAVFVKECSGEFHVQNIRVRFQKDACDEEEILVKPAVELKPGVTYFIIVEDQSEPDRDGACSAVKYVDPGVFCHYGLNSYKLRQKASVDLGCVDLQLTEIQKENRLPGFTRSNSYSTMNVIKGLKIDQV